MTLDSSALGRGEGGDIGLEAGPGPPSLFAYPEVADKDGSLEYSPGHWDGAVMASKEAELNAHLQALTLSLPDASPSSSSLLHASPVLHSLSQEALPGIPDFDFLTEDQWSLDSDVAALWLTEDEGNSTDSRNPVPSCWCLPVSAISDLELLQGLRALGESPGPITPFTRPHYLRRLQEAQAATG